MFKINVLKRFNNSVVAKKQINIKNKAFYEFMHQIV